MNASEFDTLALLAMAALSLGLPDAFGRRRVLAGALLIALALASLEVSGVSQDGNQPGAVTAFAISMGIVSLGLCMALSQVVVALRNSRWPGPARTVTLVAAMVVLVLGARVIAPLREAGGWVTALGTTVVLGAALLVISQVLQSPITTRIAQAIVRKGGWIFAPREGKPRAAGWELGASILLVVQGVGGLVALVVPGLHLLLGVVLISLAAGVLLERRRGRLSGWPVSLVLVLPAIVTAWYLLAHVAAGESLALSQLRDAPYSPAFELLVSFILGLVGWSLLSLWPFQGTPRGPFTPLLGAALIARVVAPALPEGLVHWQPVLYLLAGLAAWHAAATRRDEEALTALGALGLLSGDAAAGWAGVALVGGAVVLRLFGLLADEKRTPNFGGQLLLRGLPLAGALLIVPALTGALGTQVFYSVMTVVGIVTVLWRRGR